MRLYAGCMGGITIHSTSRDVIGQYGAKDARVHTRTHTHTHTYQDACTHTCTQTHTDTHRHTRNSPPTTHTHTHTRIHTRRNIDTEEQIVTCCTHVHIHTHKHMFLSEHRVHAAFLCSFSNCTQLHLFSLSSRAHQSSSFSSSPTSCIWLLVLRYCVHLTFPTVFCHRHFLHGICHFNFPYAGCCITLSCFTLIQDHMLLTVFRHFHIGVFPEDCPHTAATWTVSWVLCHLVGFSEPKKENKTACK